MELMAALALAKGAYELSEQIMRSVRDALEKGQVPPDQLAAVRAEYNHQRAVGGRFTGSEWELSGR